MSGAIQQAAARVYVDGGWPSTELDDGTGFTLSIDGTDGSWSALAITDDTAGRFAFYSLAPVEATAGGLIRMAEFLHRANHGLLGATFELDWDTGEVRLRSGLDVLPALLGDADLLDAVVLDVSAANVGVFDRYLSGLVAVTLGSVPVAEIIADIET